MKNLKSLTREELEALANDQAKKISGLQTELDEIDTNILETMSNKLNLKKLKGDFTTWLKKGYSRFKKEILASREKI
jgi:hypothetical protein